VRLNRQLQWGLVLLIALVSAISRLKFNGLILDFDYDIYQPDGSHYAYRTLTFLGVDSNAAADRVVSWYQINGVKNNIFEPSFLTPENKEIWGITAPRVLYSFLSMPFVFLIGLPGMLVIPIFSFVLLVSCIFRLSEIYLKPWIGFLLALVLCTSPTILRWMIANITDSLLTGLFAIVALVLTGNISKKTWFLLIFFLIVMTSLTRFCTPIWMAIAAVLWIHKERTKSFWVFLLSSISSLPTFLYMSDNAVLPADAEAQGLTKLFLLVKSYFEVGFFEIAQLAALDRGLLLLLTIATVLAFRYSKEISSRYFLAVLFAVWTIGAINGTIGVNFRYQLPVLAFACWVILSKSEQLANWFGGGRVNIKREKTQNELDSQ
jgi:hypothetical protein